MSFPQVLTGVAHIGIPTNDLDKTIAFYKKLGFVSADDIRENLLFEENNDLKDGGNV